MFTKPTKIAKPEQGTIKRTALCKTCGDLIEWHKVSRIWFHSFTGFMVCSEAYQDDEFLKRLARDFK